MAFDTVGIIKNGQKRKLPGIYVPAPQETITATADGSKTYRQLLNEIYAQLDFAKIKPSSILTRDSRAYHLQYKSATEIRLNWTEVVSDRVYLQTVIVRTSLSMFYECEIRNGTSTVTEYQGYSPSAGVTYTFYY